MYRRFDLLLLQEPYIDSYGNMKVTKDWRVAYPSNHLASDKPPCAVVLISTSLDTNEWSQISVPGTNDLVTIQVRGSSGHLRIYNIYNDCHHDDSLDALDAHLQTRQGQAGAAPDDFMLWGGNFN